MNHPYALDDPLRMIGMAAVIWLSIQLAERRLIGTAVLTVLGVITAFLFRSGDLPYAFFLLPLMGTVLAVAVSAAEGQLSIAVPLLPWSLALCDLTAAVPALAWLAVGTPSQPFGPDDRPHPGGGAHPIFRVLLLFGAMLLLHASLPIGTQTRSISPAMTKVGLGWIGLLLVHDLWPRRDDARPRASLADRIGIAILGGQTLLILTTTARSLIDVLGQEVPSNLWIVALSPIVVGLFLVAMIGSASRPDPSRPVRSRLPDVLLANATALLVVAIMAATTLPFVSTGTPIWRLTDDQLITLCWLAAAIAIPFVGVALIGSRPIPARWSTALAVLAGLPMLPLGIAWWMTLTKLAAVPLPSPLTGIPEPQPAAKLFALFVLGGPLVIVPIGLRALLPDSARREPSKPVAPPLGDSSESVSATTSDDARSQ